jgi:hypothetical protein
MTQRSLAVMIVIETEDARLFPENMDNATVAATQALRAAVIDALPGLSRVVAVMDEEEARLMVSAHAMAARQAGLDALFSHPPASYRAPGDRHAPVMPGARRRH